MRTTLNANDEPIRISASTSARATRIDARRQFLQSLWMMGVVGLAFCAVLAARPVASEQMRAVQTSAIH